MKWWLINCLFFPGILIAQKLILTEVNLSNQYFINDIVQDKRSLLWFATTEGLVYYNGFEDILISNPNLNNPQCLFIHENIIYSGYQNGYLAGWSLDDYSLMLIDSISDKRITDIEIYARRKLLIATYGDGIFSYDMKSEGSATSMSSILPDAYIYQMDLTQNQDILISTDNGLFKFNTNNNQISRFEDLPDQLITHLAISDSRIWASTYDQGIFSISNHNQVDQARFVPVKSDGIINDLILFNDYPLISTDDGLFMLNKDLSDTNYYAQDVRNKYTTLFIDVENNLWVADRNGGLWKSSLYFSKLDYSFSDNIQSILKLPNVVLLGGENGLYEFDLKGNAQRPLNHYNVTCLNMIGNLIYFGTYNSGLFVLNKNYEELIRLNQSSGLPDNAILSFEHHGDSLLFVSTLAGIAAYNLDVNTMRLTNSDFISVDSFSGLDYILNLKMDSHGNLWAGKDRTGLSKHVIGNTTQFENINGEKIGSVFSIAPSNNNIWFSSSNLGIIKYMDDQFSVIENLNNKDDPFTSIIPLPDSHLMLINKRGVELYKDEQQISRRFDQEGEFIEEEPFLNNYSIYNDEVWFVHNNEVYKFRNDPVNPLLQPTTQIERIEVNIDVVDREQKKFKQSQNNFKFNFSGRWLTDPGKLTYAYQLVGHDENWRLTKDRTAVYPKLPPGDYTFKVKSTINSFFKNEPESTFDFKIKRAFVNSIWFYLFLATILFLIVYRWNKQMQDEKLLKASLQKNQIETQLINLKAQLNPHFLFNSFNTLSGLIDESVGASKSFIENLSDFYRLMLEVGDERLIPLEKELAILKAYNYLIKERFRNGYDLIILNETLKPIFYIPPLVLQMLVENALKHNQVSSANPLIIRISIQEDSIEVKNNLIPKNFITPSTGYGLNNIISRFKILGLGEVVLNKSEEYFSVLIPLTKSI